MSNLFNCKDCGKEISKQAATCPNCGAKVKKNSPILTAFAILICLFVVCGIIGSFSKSGKTGSSALKSLSAINSSDLELLEGYKAVRNEYGNISIVGKVKNNGTKEYSYAQISFNLYDAHGAQVGTALANVNNLEPNGIWKFSAGCMEDNFKTYKFKEITGF